MRKAALILALSLTLLSVGCSSERFVGLPPEAVPLPAHVDQRAQSQAAGAIRALRRISNVQPGATLSPAQASEALSQLQATGTVQTLQRLSSGEPGAKLTAAQASAMLDLVETLERIAKAQPGAMLTTIQASAVLKLIQAGAHDRIALRELRKAAMESR